jgi:hypothetical protein
MAKYIGMVHVINENLRLLAGLITMSGVSEKDELKPPSNAKNN